MIRNLIRNWLGVVPVEHYVEDIDSIAQHAIAASKMTRQNFEDINQLQEATGLDTPQGQIALWIEKNYCYN